MQQLWVAATPQLGTGRQALLAVQLALLLLLVLLPGQLLARL